MMSKRCPGCEKDLPIKKFSKRKSTKDGLACYCRKCESGRKKEFRERYPEKIRRRDREYQRNNPEKCLRKVEKYQSTIKGHLALVFYNMKQRCNNPAHKEYKNYGGRGIRNKFKPLDDFRDYVTEVLKIDPRGLQIDRIDNDGHYERGNVRFVTAKVNANNRRK